MNEEEIQYTRQIRVYFIAEEYISQDDITLVILIDTNQQYDTCHGLSQGMIDQVHTINNNIEELNK